MASNQKLPDYPSLKTMEFAVKHLQKAYCRSFLPDLLPYSCEPWMHKDPQYPERVYDPLGQGLEANKALYLNHTMHIIERLWKRITVFEELARRGAVGYRFEVHAGLTAALRAEFAIRQRQVAAMELRQQSRLQEMESL